jgi:Tfp pilus assembly protein PilW
MKMMIQKSSSKRKLKNPMGFTLVEALVTMIIFLMVIGGLYSTLLVGESSWQNNSTKIELQQEMRKAMEWMRYELQQAGNASITTVPADGTWYTSISFKIPSGVTGGALVWGSNAIVFSKSGTRLIRTSAATTKTLANNLYSVQFRRQAASSNLLEVALVGRKTPIKGEEIEYPLDFDVKLRN